MEKTNLIFNIANTLLLVVAGLLGYFFIEKYYLVESKTNVDLAQSAISLNQAELGLYISQKVLKDLEAKLSPLSAALDLAKKNGEIVLNMSQVRLNEVNNELLKVQLDLQKTNANLDTLSRKSNITLDVSKIINDIQPTLSVTCDLSKKIRFNFKCAHLNVGAHKAYITKPSIRIYDLYSDKEIDPFKYRLEGGNSGVVGAGISSSYVIYLSDLENALSKDFVIVIQWDASLHTEVKNAVYPLLNGVIDKAILESLTTQGYTYRHVWRY